MKILMNVYATPANSWAMIWKHAKLAQPLATHALIKEMTQKNV